MNCPKCSAEMQPVSYENVEVDICTGCQGIWFDQFEAEDLKKIKGSESIDTGLPSKGIEMNDIDDIDCPKCRVKMVKMVDNKQSHIWYESCSQCYGLFFDAGEFSDYKSENFWDFFGDLFTPPRAGEKAKGVDLDGDSVNKILS